MRLRLYVCARVYVCMHGQVCEHIMHVRASVCMSTHAHVIKPVQLSFYINRICTSLKLTVKLKNTQVIKHNVRFCNTEPAKH